MNYNKLKELLIAKNITIQKAAIHIGRSQNWFHSAIKNDTMTIADLEKLLKLCKTNVFEFFGGTPSYNVVSEPSVRESELVSENTELLRENRQLRLKIESLEGKTAPPAKAKAKMY